MATPDGLASVEMTLVEDGVAFSTPVPEGAAAYLIRFERGQTGRAAP